MSGFRAQFREFLDRFGPAGFVRLAAHPLTTLLTTPWRLFQAIVGLRKLGAGRWQDFPQCSPHTALNHLFYWTVALNLHRFGRMGRSPYLGTGDYPLSRFFYYTWPSLRAYWKWGVVAVLAGMFGWLGAHGVWLKAAPGGWVIAVIALLLFSTTFYANTFGLQNYNALGWAFFPIGLYGALAGEPWVGACAWFVASFGSVTVIVIASALSAVIAGLDSSWTPIAAVAPAALKILSHLRYSLAETGFRTGLRNIAKALGASEGDAKYRRTASKSFGARRIYYLAVYAQFAAVVLWSDTRLALIVCAGLVIFLVNSRWCRFADEQSMALTMVSVAAACCLRILPDAAGAQPWFLLASFWLMASPPAVFAMFPSEKQVLDVVPPRTPISIARLRSAMEEFLAPVRKGQRVFMAFENPDGIYERIFDGQRVLLELPLYVASRLEIHFMPDWWGVFQLNMRGDADFWGRSPEQVKEHLARWGADFAVIYTKDDQPDAEWERRGFEQLGKFDWRDFRAELAGTIPCRGEVPVWWLMKKP